MYLAGGRKVHRTDMSSATKTVWVIALVLLAVGAAIAGSEGLKWAFGNPSLLDRQRPNRVMCRNVGGQPPQDVARRLGIFATAALLESCRQRDLPDLAR
jgi:hypothetical protein